MPINYVPVMKWKRGEYSALGLLTNDVKDQIKPLIETMPIPDADGETQRQFVASIAKQISANWGPRPAFVDLGLMDPDDRLPGNTHPLIFLFEASRRAGLQLIPVTGFRRDDMYQQALEAVVGEAGVCVRLAVDEFTDDALDDEMDDLLGRFSLEPEFVDIVLDLRAVAVEGVANLRAALRNAIAEFPRVNEWRSLILVGTGFPVDLSALQPGVRVVPRSTFLLWRNLVTSRRHRLVRRPIFGDYGVSHFELPDLAPGMFTASASIRYTTNEEWLVFRGRAAWGPGARQFGGFDQFFELAAQVVAHPAYCGADYSAGDSYIQRCAHRDTGPGNLETWRQVATNHHITFVARQIANAFADAAGA